MTSPLYVVTSISNHAGYSSRYRLYNEFSARMAASAAELYTIELVGDGQPFAVTSAANARHIQIRSGHELWYKENLINIAISRLPRDWEHVAWVDADVLFARPDWVDATVRQLASFAFVQMFSHVVDLGPHYEPLSCEPGFVFQHRNDPQRRTVNGAAPMLEPSRLGATGYAWAARRKELTAVGNLIDWDITGAGDYYMALGLTEDIDPAATGMPGSNFADSLLEWQTRCQQHVRRNVGHVDATLLHYWHGSRKDRGYNRRWRVLAAHDFDPATDLHRRPDGLLELTNDKPDLREAIRKYFRSRNEDNMTI